MIRKLMVKALACCFVLAVIFACSTTSYAQKVKVLEGTLNKVKLKPNISYLLRGGVFIKKKLIAKKPGVTVFGLPGSFLVIDQGATVNLLGTREQPIVFTSAAPVGTKRRGDWGGLIFNGRAPINIPGGTAIGEGDTGTYGGNDPNDNSGTMRFVRVEYGGFAISPDNELNCIVFQGVGSATTVEFVQAAFGGDDGFEWFGGTCNGKFLVSTGASDDSFDWADGWTGKVQFAVVQQRADEADAGFECDNNEDNFNFTPRSAPRMMNFTVVGDPGQGPGSTRGILFRRGTAGQFRNFIVMGFKNVGLEIRDQATFDQINSGAMSLAGFIFFGNGVGLQTPSNFSGDTAAAVNQMGTAIMQANPLLTDPFNQELPDFRPQAGSPALDPANVQPPFTNDTFFVATDFIGAFDANDDWTLGWTNWIFGN